MRIQIQDKEHRFTLRLPTMLLFGRFSAGLICRASYKYAPDAVENISPEHLKALLAEMGRIRKKYGRWELVEVESADGTYIKITL